MVKPIFIVELPITFTFSQLDEISNLLTEKLIDYYVLVVRNSVSKITFKCFYEKDFDEIKYEELKQLITNLLDIPKVDTTNSTSNV